MTLRATVYLIAPDGIVRDRVVLSLDCADSDAATFRARVALTLRDQNLLVAGEWPEFGPIGPQWGIR